MAHQVLKEYNIFPTKQTRCCIHKP